MKQFNYYERVEEQKGTLFIELETNNYVVGYVDAFEEGILYFEEHKKPMIQVLDFIDEWTREFKGYNEWDIKDLQYSVMKNIINLLSDEANAYDLVDIYETNGDMIETMAIFIDDFVSSSVLHDLSSTTIELEHDLYITFDKVGYNEWAFVAYLHSDEAMYQAKELANDLWEGWNFYDINIYDEAYQLKESIVCVHLPELVKVDVEDKVLYHLGEGDYRFIDNELVEGDYSIEISKRIVPKE